MMTEFWGPKTGQAKNVIGTLNYSEMFGFVDQPQDPGPFKFHKNNINVLFADGHVESVPGNLEAGAGDKVDNTWNGRGYNPPKSPTK
jgi:prepilin-type processing-associated H-X9-DG protein